MTIDADQLLLLAEFAQIVRVPISTARHWVRTKKVRSLRIGRRRLVPRSELERLLREAEAKS